MGHALPDEFAIAPDRLKTVIALALSEPENTIIMSLSPAGICESVLKSKGNAHGSRTKHSVKPSEDEKKSFQV